jgi:hypothetical protein
VLKRAFAAGLVVTMLAPVARADELASSAEASEVETTAPIAPIALHRVDVLARSPLPLVAPRFELSEPQMTDVRLTHSEKVIIIVAACVVGAIILIFAVGKPHKHW